MSEPVDGLGSGNLRDASRCRTTGLLETNDHRQTWSVVDGGPRGELGGLRSVGGARNPPLASPRIRRNAPRAGSFAPGQSSANIGPELIPHVPDEPAEESVADPAHVLRRRRRARGKPGVRNEVAADRPCITRPRRSQSTAPARGNQHRLRRIPGSRPDPGAARGKIPRVFAPCRAQPGLDRI